MILGPTLVLGVGAVKVAVLDTNVAGAGCVGIVLVVSSSTGAGRKRFALETFVGISGIEGDPPPGANACACSRDEFRPATNNASNSLQLSFSILSI